MIHVVSQGETVAQIAARYGVSEARLRYDNQIEDVLQLVVGQALLVLIPEQIHQVSEGETLEAIAAAYGTTVRQIVQNNPFLTEEGQLYAGESLVIRYQREEGEAPGPAPFLGGYAYPFVEPYVIDQSLPYLTGMYLFSYGFTENGELVLPADPTYLLDRAGQLGAGTVLVLTPLTEEGVFNSALVSSLVNDREIQEVLADNLLREMEEEGYGALDVDFEFVEPADRDAYVEFVDFLRGRMNAAGYTVSVALAPKYSDEQGGVLYGGIDYRGLGEAADSVLVMAYEWGYTYGPPMAVAPLNQVRRVMDYAVSRIDPAKICLGIPNYGYDWPLPYVRGTTQARVVGNVEAVELAADTGSEVRFDEAAQSPYFSYREGGTEHVVWFEDVRSMTARFRLITEYGLRGAGFWNLMKPFRACWLLWNQMFGGGEQGGEGEWE